MHQSQFRLRLRPDLAGELTALPNSLSWIWGKEGNGMKRMEGRGAGEKGKERREGGEVRKRRTGREGENGKGRRVKGRNEGKEERLGREGRGGKERRGREGE